jgi:hypothetical protein
MTQGVGECKTEWQMRMKRLHGTHEEASLVGQAIPAHSLFGCSFNGHANAEDTLSPCAFRKRFQQARTRFLRSNPTRVASL